jgi:ABC-type phosphate/phosphonate transport system ATPase subunit
MPESKKRSSLGTLGAIAGAGGATIAAAVAAKGVRKDLLSRASRLVKGTHKNVALHKGPPAEVTAQAKKLRKALRKAGVSPEKARIAISGVGGSGKSTFARELASQLGMPASELNKVVKAKSQISNAKRYKYELPGGGSVSEQTQLLARETPDAYDVIMHLDTPKATRTSRILNRGRGAWQHDVYKPGNINKDIRTNFDTSGMDSIKSIGDLHVKVRGKKSGTSSVDQLVAAAGGKPGMSHGQKLMFLRTGKKMPSQRLDYVNKKRVGAILAAPVAGGALGGAIGSQTKTAAKESTSPSLATLPLGAAAGTALGLAALKGTRKDLAYKVKMLLGKVKRDPGLGQAIPSNVQHSSKRLIKELRRAGVDPRKARIAVVGTGGSGKSTIARGIADQLGTKANELDIVGKNTLSGRRLSEYMGRHAPGKGSVYEQTHLLNKVDPRHFNVVVKVNTPTKVVKDRLLKRQRGAWQHDFYNIDKLNKVIDKGFRSAGGKRLNDVDNLSISVSKKGNTFGDGGLKKEMRSRKMSPKGMTREEMLQSLVGGKRESGAPAFSYFKKGKLLAAASAPVAGATGLYQADKYRLQRKQKKLDLLSGKGPGPKT